MDKGFIRTNTCQYCPPHLLPKLRRKCRNKLLKGHGIQVKGKIRHIRNALFRWLANPSHTRLPAYPLRLKLRDTVYRGQGKCPPVRRYPSHPGTSPPSSECAQSCTDTGLPSQWTILKNDIFSCRPPLPQYGKAQWNPYYLKKTGIPTETFKNHSIRTVVVRSGILSYKDFLRKKIIIFICIWMKTIIFFALRRISLR